MNISDKNLRVLCRLTSDLTRMRQAECKNLAIENFSPDLLASLIRALQAGPTADGARAIGSLPEPDMCHEKARDDTDTETSYSAEAMEAERRRCYLLGLSRGWHNGVSTNPGDQA